MKKNPLIHPEISKVIASLGQGDRLVIATAHLPIGIEVHRIDLALAQDIPSIGQTLKIIQSEMHIAEVILSEEVEREFPTYFNQLVKQLDGIPLTQVLHVVLKQQTKMAKAVIRTGDFTLFASMILLAGMPNPNS